MAKECKKCGRVIPKFLMKEGKKINLQTRKYCFLCSPFGLHNTRQLDKIPQLLNKICVDCGKSYKREGRRCPTCYFNVRRSKVIKKVDEIVGTKCWLCGYNRTRKNLCFHHVHPEQKLLSLTTRETMLKWDRILLEIKKCVLLCANCHGEVHAELIDTKIVEELYQRKWDEIFSSGKLCL